MGRPDGTLETPSAFKASDARRCASVTNVWLTLSIYHEAPTLSQAQFHPYNMMAPLMVLQLGKLRLGACTPVTLPPAEEEDCFAPVAAYLPDLEGEFLRLSFEY